ncbi:uncharacterized protein MCYG_07451 [Microsporum canis CBS 113480]|uniref:Uncharacterized protein n=1 Tax=Arthroderma otae (strain ATCC MYA-4605 / CBS 113480) TaxID=554155 RepID=C5FYN4_ARTOC|nr:uncharacterized protein MCYG_07451 [Microsporum canis CBS 113480]EEQ34632.1 predicted protein [Microsporum canis CBS 113480]
MSDSHEGDGLIGQPSDFYTLRRGGVKKAAGPTFGTLPDFLERAPYLPRPGTVDRGRECGTGRKSDPFTAFCITEPRLMQEEWHISKVLGKKPERLAWHK